MCSDFIFKTERDFLILDMKELLDLIDGMLDFNELAVTIDQMTPACRNYTNKILNEMKKKITKTKTGIELITKERERQIKEEGYTIEHDDSHYSGELAQAARAYYYNDKTIFPWDLSFFKPITKTLNYEKAGALVLAEIQRLTRLKNNIIEDLDNIHKITPNQRIY